MARAHLGGAKALKDGAGSSGAGADMGLNTQWEELRKQARKLESEVDAELASFSKLGGAGACGCVHSVTDALSIPWMEPRRGDRVLQSDAGSGSLERLSRREHADP